MLFRSRPAELGPRFPSDVRASTAVNSDRSWVDIVRKVRPIVHHLRVRVVILHRPVFGSLRRKVPVGGGQNLHLKDFRQHPAQDRACCTHTATAGYPRFPDLRPIGAPIPVSRPNRETGDFPIPDSRPIGPADRESEVPSPFPGQIGNRGNGNWGFPGLDLRLHSVAG